MSVTIDEGTHYFCGMQWWQEGRYNAWPENPVFSRLVIAAGPYLQGYRTSGFNPQGDELSFWDHFLNTYRLEFFHAEGMEDHLFWIRIFVLPFFFLSIVVVWIWSRRLGGDFAAMISTGVYAFTPVLMGHSGLATTDIIFMSTFTILIWTFYRWLNHASYINAVWFGLGLAFAMLSKYSVLPFFGIAMLVSFFLKWYLDRPQLLPVKNWIMSWLYSGLLASAVMFFVIWAFHGFHVGAIGSEPVIRTLMETGQVSKIYDKIIVPAPEWFAGILILMVHNAEGHTAYMLGEISSTGFWYFYPLGLTVKTPLPALVIGVLGFIGIVRNFKSLNWEVVATFFVPFALMLSVMSSHINIGVRHISTVYPLFAVGATASTLFLFDYLSENWKGNGRYILITLLIAQVTIALFIYPNYTNYFNILAGNEPGKVMGDSDLGWGQGLIELSEYAQENQIDTLHFSYFGVADDCMYDLPTIVPLSVDEPVKGWVAISENNYHGIFGFNEDLFNIDPKCRILALQFFEMDKPHTLYDWLKDHEPKAVMANSIRVYHIE